MTSMRTSRVAKQRRTVNVKPRATAAAPRIRNPQPKAPLQHDGKPYASNGNLQYINPYSRTVNLSARGLGVPE